MKYLLLFLAGFLLNAIADRFAIPDQALAVAGFAVFLVGFLVYGFICNTSKLEFRTCDKVLGVFAAFGILLVVFALARGIAGHAA